MRNKQNAPLRESEHMQPAAMELLTELQRALCGSTGLVLADTHARKYLHDPVKKLDCSGLAGSERLWSQLVLPIEFKLHTADADAALGQLTETAGIVQRQQPERRFLYAVSITMDTVELFQFSYGPLASFSRILSSDAQPLRLRPDSAGLRLLACIVAAPLAQLGFLSAALPAEGQLGPHRFSCTSRLAIRTDLTTTGHRKGSYVFRAQLEGLQMGVLKLAKNDNEVGLVSIHHCWA